MDLFFFHLGAQGISKSFHSFSFSEPFPFLIGSNCLFFEVMASVSFPQEQG